MALWLGRRHWWGAGVRLGHLCGFRGVAVCSLGRARVQGGKCSKPVYSLGHSPAACHGFMASVGLPIEQSPRQGTRLIGMRGDGIRPFAMTGDGHAAVINPFCIQAAKRGCMIAGSDRTLLRWWLPRFDSPKRFASHWGATTRPPDF